MGGGRRSPSTNFRTSILSTTLQDDGTRTVEFNNILGVPIDICRVYRSSTPTWIFGSPLTRSLSCSILSMTPIQQIPNNWHASFCNHGFDYSRVHIFVPTPSEPFNPSHTSEGTRKGKCCKLVASLRSWTGVMPSTCWDYSGRRVTMQSIWYPGKYESFTYACGMKCCCHHTRPSCRARTSSPTTPPSGMAPGSSTRSSPCWSILESSSSSTTLHS